MSADAQNHWEKYSPFTNILVPIDGSDTSIDAGKLAIQIATTHKIPITFMYVIDVNTASRIAQATDKTKDAVDHQLQDKGRRYLDYLSRQAKGKGLTVNQIVRHGIPHSEIASFAREKGIDLIVIGQVGRRRQVRIGYVAERIIEYAHCPVLVVKASSNQG